MRQRLIKLHDVFVNSGNFFQIIRVADARELGFFLIGRKVGIVVFWGYVKAEQIPFGFLGDRRVGEKLLQELRRFGFAVFTLASTTRAEVDDELVDAEGLLVEEDLGPES